MQTHARIPLHESGAGIERMPQPRAVRVNEHVKLAGRVQQPKPMELRGRDAGKSAPDPDGTFEVCGDTGMREGAAAKALDLAAGHRGCDRTPAQPRAFEV